MTEKRIDVLIIEDVLDEKFWRLTDTQIHKSGHMYRNSPYETDDSCGNCDGARCEHCHDIVEEAHFECGIEVNLLEDMLKKHDVPEENASDLACNDFCYGTDTSGKYHMVWPYEWMLKEDYPEFYKKISSKDEDLWKEFDEYYNVGLYPTQEAAKKRGLKYYTDDQHLWNQYMMWNEAKIKGGKK